jgi:hypothetical protein
MGDSRNRPRFAKVPISARMSELLRDWRVRVLGSHRKTQFGCRVERLVATDRQLASRAPTNHAPRARPYIVASGSVSILPTGTGGDMRSISRESGMTLARSTR